MGHGPADKKSSTPAICGTPQYPTHGISEIGFGDAAGNAKDGDTTASYSGMALSLKWSTLSMSWTSCRGLIEDSIFSSMGDYRERLIQLSGLQLTAMIERSQIAAKEASLESGAFPGSE